MLSDLGVAGKSLRIRTDSSGAKSLASRRGLGGIRHIEVNQVLSQGKVNNGNNGEIEIEEVMGTINRVDVLAKPKNGGSIKQHSLWTKERHELVPKPPQVEKVQRKDMN